MGVERGLRRFASSLASVLPTQQELEGSDNDTQSAIEDNDSCVAVGMPNLIRGRAKRSGGGSVAIHCSCVER